MSLLVIRLELKVEGFSSLPRARRVMLRLLKYIFQSLKMVPLDIFKISYTHGVLI